MFCIRLRLLRSKGNGLNLQPISTRWWSYERGRRQFRIRWCGVLGKESQLCRMKYLQFIYAGPERVIFCDFQGGRWIKMPCKDLDDDEGIVRLSSQVIVVSIMKYNGPKMSWSFDPLIRHSNFGNLLWAHALWHLLVDGSWVDSQPVRLLKISLQKNMQRLESVKDLDN